MAVLLRVPEVEDPDFIAEMSYAEGAVLKLVGSADRTALAALGELFAAVHDALGTRQARSVVVDTTEVDYLAAPCVRELIAWIERVQALAPERRYTIRLRGNPGLGWQTHGLAALACFDPELVRVEG